MSDFLQALHDLPFVRLSLIVGLLASVAFGMTGAYVVVRRISYLAGAISHCVLGGIGAGLYLERVQGWTWCGPMMGAVVAALAAAILVGLVSLRAGQREDTVIGAIWVLGMAAGLLFLQKTPGFVDPMSYLFGDITLVSHTDLWLVGGLDLLVGGAVWLFFPQFLAICFDEEFARLRGIRVEVYYLLLLCLTALTIVLLVKILGILMVIALLTLPAATASLLTRKLRSLMALSVVLCAVFTSGGLACAYAYDLYSGPVIILIAGAVYLLALLVQKLRPVRLESSEQ